MSLNPLGTLRLGNAIHRTCIYPHLRTIVRLATVTATQSYNVRRTKTHQTKKRKKNAHVEDIVALRTQAPSGRLSWHPSS